MIGTLRLWESGNMTPALELEIDPWIMRTRSVWARRRVSVTDSFGSPRSSATTNSTGRPPIPPAALISSRERQREAVELRDVHLAAHPLVLAHAREKDADLRGRVHRLGDGNTADRGLSIQVYHRAQCSPSSSSTG